MDHKAVFLDIDGTIYVKGEPGIRPVVLEELRRIREQGVRVFIASGRPSSALPAFLNAIQADGMILANGAQIRLGVRDETKFLPEHAIREAVSLLEKLGASYAVQTDTATYNVRGMEGYYTPYGVEFVPLAGETSIYGRTLKIELLLTPDLRKAIDAFETPLGKVYHPDGFSMEFNDPTISKGDGLRTASELLGIDASQTVAFGDATNDIDMLCAAGLGVAMGNAEEAVKQSADRVCPSVFENGVAQMLRELFPEA